MANNENHTTEEQSVKKWKVRDKHGHVKKSGSLAVVGSVNVEVDSTGGDHPTADSTYQNGQLDITLHDIKGKRGNGITSIDTEESQVDEGDNIVHIHCTDDEEAEGTQFRVKNGSRGNGIASVTEQTSSEDGGINTHTIHYTDPNVPDSVIHTRNGRTGKQGASAVFDPETGNVLATLMPDIGDDDANAMTQVAVTNEVTVDKRTVAIPSSGVGRYINSSKKWVAVSGNDGYRYATTPGTIFKIKGNDTNAGEYAFLTSVDTSGSNSNAQFADGYSAVVTIPVNGDLILVAPSNAAYLYVRLTYSSTDVRPLSVVVAGRIKDEINGLLTSVENIKTDITDKNVIMTPVRTSGYGSKSLYFNGSEWKYNANHATTIIAVEPGKAYWVLPNASQPFVYALLTSVEDYANTGTIHYSGGTAKTYSIAAGTLTRIEIPNDTCAIAYYSKYSNTDRTLQTIYKEELVKELANEQENFIEALSESIEEQGYASVEVKTITSLVEDTYVGGYSPSAGHNFKTSSTVGTNKLIYFPEYYVVGGESMTVRYTGRSSISVYAASYLKLGTSHVDAYDTSDITLVKNLPANTSESYTGEETFVLPSNCRRVALVVNASAEIFPNSIALEITSIDLPVMSAAKLTIPNSVDAVEKARVKELASQSRYVNISANVTASSLGLLHFTDIHGSQGAADAIVEMAEHLKAYINGILCTGDCPVSKADDTASEHGVSWWKNDSGLADKSLFTIGNHDAATTSPTEYDSSDEGMYFDGKGKDWCFDNYFEPYISGLGYVMPEGYDDPESDYYKACYWHKDYSSQKVRLIGLDCMHRFDGTVDPATGEILTEGFKQLSNAQELWLIEKLNETLDSTNAAYGYSVVVCCHYALDNFSGSNEAWNDSTHKFTYNQRPNGGRVMSEKSGQAVNFHYGEEISFTAEKRFNLLNREADPNKTYGFNVGTVNNFGEIIKAWMTNGGKFVVWLSGHTHMDYMYYPTNYPNILVVDCDQAGYLRPMETGRRSEGTPSGVCANFITIDTQNKLIKIVRIGYTMNKLLNSHEYMCYNYDTRRVLNEG